jgi:hypothetical protein
VCFSSTCRNARPVAALFAPPYEFCLSNSLTSPFAPHDLHFHVAVHQIDFFFGSWISMVNTIPSSVVSMVISHKVADSAYALPDINITPVQSSVIDLFLASFVGSVIVRIKWDMRIERFDQPSLGVAAPLPDHSIHAPGRLMPSRLVLDNPLSNPVDDAARSPAYHFSVLGLTDDAIKGVKITPSGSM